MLEFGFRAPRIIEEIRSSEASLVCLQEVDHIDDFYDGELKGLGFNVIYGKRESPDAESSYRGPEKHTIAIAYKTSDWVLIDKELIDLGEVSQWFDQAPSQYSNARNKNAMLVLLRHQFSSKSIVVGNAHLEHRPELDHVKYAQTAFLMEKAAKYIQEHKGMAFSLPFICGGDWNSMPISSVLSAFYGEDIENV